MKKSVKVQKRGYYFVVDSVFAKIFTAIAGALIIWLIIANFLNIKDQYFLTPITVFIILCAIFFIPKNLREKIFSWLKNHQKIVKIMCLILVVFAIIARFLFLTFEFHAVPPSDSGVFFETAKNIAAKNSLGESAQYTATFPYLFAYETLLGGAMKIFGSGVFSVIILNTLIDIFSAILLFILVKNLTKSQKRGGLRRSYG